MNSQDVTLDLASTRYLNESAIRAHALTCSRRIRAGHFTRVGQDFIDEVKADVEAVVRELRAKGVPRDGELIAPETSLLTGALSDKLGSVMNLVIAKIIQNKVRAMPSCGVTLGRTH